MIALAATFVLALAASLAVTPLCRLASLRLGFVAKPRLDRWNSRPTALLGGIAVATITLTGSVLAGAGRDLTLLLICSGLMFLLGLADDVRNLKPSTKLIGEIAIASVLVYFDFRLGWLESLTGDTVLTLLWIVGITNAFNLLDNMDGLCSGIAMIAGVSLLFTLTGENTAAATFLALLLGALAGFLVYNWNPASIFLGDSGSLFIGFSLAFLTLSATADAGSMRNVLSVIAAPVFVLLIPIFDTTLVTLSRIFWGRKPSTGGRDHSSHRLVAIGLSERRAVIVLWSLAAASGGIGVLLHRVGEDWSALVGSLFLLGMVIFAVYLAHVRVYEDVDPMLLRSGRVTLMFADFMHKRRAAEVLLDLCLVSIAYYSAYRLRFEGEDWRDIFPTFTGSFPIVFAGQMLSFFAVGVYRGVWRYFTLYDAVVFAKGVIGGTVAIIAIGLLGPLAGRVSIEVFVIYAALLLLLVTGSRASFRIISEFVERRRASGERVVIYGTGSGGSIVVRELHSSPDSYRILGFVDDDKQSHRTTLHGYPVLGGVDRLEALVIGGGIDTVVIGMRVVDVAKLVMLQQLCASRGVKLLRLHVDFLPVGQTDPVGAAYGRAEGM